VTRRRTQGIDANRLCLLAAVLEKKLHLNLFDKDIFVNVVGGLKTEDPAVDLAVCVAVGSSLYDRPVPADTVVLGEVGLAAEVRSVAHAALRVNEAKKLGFRRFLLPCSNGASASQGAADDAAVFTAVSDVPGAFRALWKDLS
jgi:DNA repair protein RadA/Sms